MSKKIMVTGAGGYIGTQLVRDLLKSGYSVKGVDRFFFGKESINEFIENKNASFIQKDIRDLEVEDFDGISAVCDLACLSNDPSGEIDPELTYRINRDGRIHVAKMAKKSGVGKYIISSSCSVYGEGSENQLTEESSTNPLSAYAKSTLQAEQENLSISNSNFAVTALRNATVFGLSTRMRFDLVVNLMTLSAFERKRILIMGGGKQWRPLVHVSDVSKAFIKSIEADSISVNSEIFNIGLDNFQISNLASLVREVLPFPIEIELAPDDIDKRNYNVNFNKAKNILGFIPEKNVHSGIDEIYRALKKGTVDTGLKTNTVKWYTNILESKKLLDSIELNSRII
jgi:nucleoside-diphosphate-sugar epimerase